MICSTCSIPIGRCGMHDSYFEDGFWWHRVCARSEDREGQLYLIFPAGGRFLPTKMQEEEWR